jgi:hypothetical protein
MNATILGNVASETHRYCQTRSLCDEYGLSRPPALTTGADESLKPDVT